MKKFANCLFCLFLFLSLNQCGFHFPSQSPSQLSGKVVHIENHIADGRFSNQLQRRLKNHGVNFKGRNPIRIVLLDEIVHQKPAISGSDNLSANLWIEKTVHFHILKSLSEREPIIYQVTEIRLLRRNFNQLLASDHEMTSLLVSMNTALAEKIVLQLKQQRNNPQRTTITKKS